jgi:hypothetical protein
VPDGQLQALQLSPDVGDRAAAVATSSRPLMLAMLRSFRGAARLAVRARQVSHARDGLAVTVGSRVFGSFAGSTGTNRETNADRHWRSGSRGSGGDVAKPRPELVRLLHRQAQSRARRIVFHVTSGFPRASDADHAVNLPRMSSTGATATPAPQDRRRKS